MDNYEKELMKRHSENYFIYKGIAYGVGTKVLFTEERDQRLCYKGARGKPHTFVAGWSNGEKRFQWQENDDWRKGIFSIPYITNPDQEIKEIIEPVYANITPWQKQAINNMTSGKVHTDVFGGVLLYIDAMLVGVIFKDRWLIWIFGTIIFVIWLLKQYRT